MFMEVIVKYLLAKIRLRRPLLLVRSQMLLPAQAVLVQFRDNSVHLVSKDHHQLVRVTAVIKRNGTLVLAHL